MYTIHGFIRTICLLGQQPFPSITQGPVRSPRYCNKLLLWNLID